MLEEPVLGVLAILSLWIGRLLNPWISRYGDGSLLDAGEMKIVVFSLDGETSSETNGDLSSSKDIGGTEASEADCAEGASLEASKANCDSASSENTRGASLEAGKAWGLIAERIRGKGFLDIEKDVGR